VRSATELDEALREADRYFMGRGSVREAALAITRSLTEQGIDHAVAGAIACAAHGHERMTTDVVLLITREGLRRFKEAWLGRGHVEITPGLKAVRDTRRDVKIDFLLTGDYPGDGKPKPVAFPEPATVSEDAGPYRILTLPALLELKIASGASAPHRMRDLDDAMRLIRASSLAREYADRLDPSVRAKYLELWEWAQLEEDY
jgi:hypothetical protein